MLLVENLIVNLDKSKSKVNMKDFWKIKVCLFNSVVKVIKVKIERFRNKSIKERESR